MSNPALKPIPEANAEKLESPQSLTCTLANYSTIKRLPIAFLQGFGLSDIHLQGQPAIRMPYRNAAGGDHAIRHRTALFKSKNGDNRFRWKKGTKLCLYGLWRLDRKASSVVIVEGESDCHTLWHYDINAVGLPGAGNWKEERDARYFDSFETIYVVIEPDMGGEAVRRWLGRSSVRDRVKLVTLDGVKDVSDLHCADPDSFKIAWDKAVANAEPWTEYEAKILNAERRDQRTAAWEQCRSLAEETDILAAFANDLDRLRVVGVTKEAKIIFLALVSRLLPSRLVSVAVKGPSSSGKSFLVDEVLSFFPASAFYQLTAMSERALAYSDEPLKNRFLVIREAEGMGGDIGSYLIRSLLSENRLDYETVEKTPDGMRSRLIKKEGPTGLIVTTTKDRLHSENETRLMSITLRDTPEQTKAILLSMAGEQDAVVPDMSKWQALQDWLSIDAPAVVIPYDKELLSMIPPTAVRMRRDAMTVLQLIRTHALLHKATRKTNDRGLIEATYADYAVIHGLIADMIAEGVEASVPETVRETVNAVESITGNHEAATVKQVAKLLNLDQSAASRRCRTAQNRGYISNQETSRGRPAQYVIVDPIPDETKLLPDPAELEAAVNDARFEDSAASPNHASTDSKANGPSVCTCAPETEGINTPPPFGENPRVRRVVL